MSDKAGKTETKGGSLSSNLLNMKFMKRGAPELALKEEAPALKLAAATSPSSEGWSAPSAQKLMPKKVYKSPISLGFSDLEGPVFGRMVWKNGSCKQVLDDQPEVPPSLPDPVPVKKKRPEGKSGSTKKPKKKAKR